MLIYYAIKLQRAIADYLTDYGLTYVGFAAGIFIGYLILN